MRSLHARRWFGVNALLVGILGIGCSSHVSDPGPSTTARPVNVVPLSRKLARECESLAGGRLACPRLVPETETAPRSEAFSPVRDHVVFFVEWSGPHPGIVLRNQPPRFAHLVIQAGDLEAFLPFEIPAVGSGVRAVRRPSPRRRRAITFGRRVWGGRRGILVLAPPFPSGGLEADHLMFVWRADDMDHSVSLHSWLPLDQAEATLSEVVRSIPPET